MQAERLQVSELRTSYYHPWALIYSGGRIPGQRRRTALAWIHQAIANDAGRIETLRIRFFRGGALNKQTTLIEPGLVAFEFRIRRFEKPDLKRIAAAKRTLT